MVHTTKIEQSYDGGPHKSGRRTYTYFKNLHVTQFLLNMFGPDCVIVFPLNVSVMINTHGFPTVWYGMVSGCSSVEGRRVSIPKTLIIAGKSSV